MLRSFDRLPRADFEVKDAEFGRLRELVGTWRQQIEFESRDGLG